MARPKSEDKKQALLEAATQAIAQSGIAASTAVIARNAGVAEGTTAAWRLQIENRPGSSCCCRTPRRI
ncbi:hypothetical protein NA471_14545, partial [Salmonella sp. NW547]